jgi:beta-lactamase regulating signal transducer with metallopeptidase domain
MNAITIDFPSLNFISECFSWCMIQVTLFAVASLLVYGLVRRQGSHRNVLLLVASLAIVGAMTLTCLSPWPRWQLVLELPWKDAQSQTPMTVAESLPHVPKPDLGGTPGAFSDGRGHDLHATPRSSLDLRNLGLRDVPPSVPVVAEAAQPWWRFAAGAAGLLTAVGIARFLAGAAFVQRYRRHSMPIGDAHLVAEFHALVRELNITASVQLVEVPSLGVAATIGWRRPLVLLPAAWRNWTANERRAVLAHELSHVAQRHFPLWLVGQAAVATHFYHPLVHWLGRRLRLEQELAADELAVRLFGNRHAYTNALAGLALGPSRRATAHASLGLFMSRPLVMRRIAMLRQPTDITGRPSPFVRVVALALLIVAAGTAFGLRSAYDVAAANEPASVVAAPPLPAPALPNDKNAVAVTALIQISNDSANLLGRSSSEPSWKVFSRTQAALLGSKFVLQLALRKPEIAKLPLVAAQENPLDWLDRRLGVGFIDDTEILRVTLTGNSAELDQLRQIVDAVVRTYMDEIVGTEGQRRLAVRDALAKSYQKISDEIRSKLEEHNSLATELGILSSNRRDPQTEILLQELIEATKSKAELEGQLAELQTNYLVMEQQLQGTRSIDALVDQQLAADSNMAMLNQELMQLQYQLSAEMRAKKEGDSKVPDRLQQQIDAKLRRIAQFREQLKSKLKTADTSTPNPDLEKIRKEFQIRAGVLQQQLQSLNKSIQEKKEDLYNKNQRSVELEVGAAELAQLRNVANDMALKLEQMDVEAVAPPRVRVIQWAM